ncbi:fibrinogen alpha chain-like [Aplysia californica]|uniref:Fibrinogen alpha chain-like n=1 Tax=Aplysia californica TaxID=6500 RepID=A0ABM1W0W4_APLCA|nr:fibrinogen alpha chain-like [Aplysia californica]
MGSHPHHLIVQLQETTTVFYQRYFNNFVMTNETSDYAVTHTGSWSPADKLMEDCWPGTSLKFSTFDRDNDDNEDNCAAIYGAGFWFQSENCTVCNPNGDVYPSLTSRLGIESENFWTPTLGDWNPRAVGIFLVRQ